MSARENAESLGRHGTDTAAGLGVARSWRCRGKLSMGAVSRSQGQVYPQLEAGELHALWSNKLDFEQDSGRIVAISGDKKKVTLT